MRARPETSAAAAQQAAFAQALLHLDAPTPAGLTTYSEAEAARRFAVYRNNVRVSLVAALGARYPVVRRLVGAEFFDAAALLFIAQHPPTGPVLANYGAGFDAFLASFEPAADLPYLPDMAKLEWLRHRAFHAADADPIGIDRLAMLPPERLDTVRLALHPAVQFIVSPWPVLSIWTTNTEDDEVRPLGPEAGSESVLVTRPALQVLTQRLPAGADRLLAALADNAPLGAAVAAAVEAEPAFDIAGCLALLFSAGAIVGLTEGSRS
ncbi:hypothetical protein SAMN02745126_06237 [Enhydrobacter aerosaccus]|uniref:Putative DNA-binding domain-containing protein n=1 Tax=Enhydrobacter aerosaccus TaxID=225324 RepID=A0A1T4TGM4_9HYPH|nr:DNA-binding domain-containing protein [Enhydrobacter aerosaccus]SKA39441.1 hypothetical protein SAMN02745126_06237 [Enhydrobacter aerosaccus]